MNDELKQLEKINQVIIDCCNTIVQLAAISGVSVKKVSKYLRIRKELLTLQNELQLIINRETNEFINN